MQFHVRSLFVTVRSLRTRSVRYALSLLRVLLGLATLRERASVLEPLGLVAVPSAVLLFLAMLVDSSLFAAAANPWETGVNKVCTAFFGPIGRGLSVVAVVVGGLMFAFCQRSLKTDRFSTPVGDSAGTRCSFGLD